MEEIQIVHLFIGTVKRKLPINKLAKNFYILTHISSCITLPNQRYAKG